MKPTPLNKRTESYFQIAGPLRLIFCGMLILITGYTGYFFFQVTDKYAELQLIRDFPFGYGVRLLENLQFWRYTIAPLAGTIAIFLCAGSFVRDIYASLQLRQGVKYVLSSMFGFFIPEL